MVVWISSGAYGLRLAGVAQGTATSSRTVCGWANEMAVYGLQLQEALALSYETCRIFFTSLDRCRST